MQAVRGRFAPRGSPVSYANAPFNVHELDDDGKVVLRLCVVPQDITAPGDIMLAQKIWLEKNELETCRIANQGPP